MVEITGSAGNARLWRGSYTGINKRSLCRDLNPIQVAARVKCRRTVTAVVAVSRRRFHVATQPSSLRCLSLCKSAKSRWLPSIIALYATTMPINATSLGARLGQDFAAR